MRLWCSSPSWSYMRDLLPASSIDSRVSCHSPCRIHAVSSKFNVLRRSPHQSFAMSSNVPCFRHSESCEESSVSVDSWIASYLAMTIRGYLSCIFSLFFSRNTITSSGRIGSRTYVLHRERRALITVKLGFSVVAPMSVIIPFSTHGRSTSCCDLDQRCISSRKSIVCCPHLKLFCALEIILTTSSFFERTPER